MACVLAGSANTACFSFYATKNLTCGEGGAVIARDRRSCTKSFACCGSTA